MVTTFYISPAPPSSGRLELGSIPAETFADPHNGLAPSLDPFQQLPVLSPSLEEILAERAEGRSAAS